MPSCSTCFWASEEHSHLYYCYADRMAHEPTDSCVAYTERKRLNPLTGEEWPPLEEPPDRNDK